MSPIGILYLIGIAIVGTLIARRLFELPRWLTISIGPPLGIVITSSITLIVALTVGFTISTLIVALLLVLVFVIVCTSFVSTVSKWVTRARGSQTELHTVAPPELAGTMHEVWDTRAAGPIETTPVNNEKVLVSNHLVPVVKPIIRLEWPFIGVLILLGSISFYIFGTKVLNSENGNLVTGGGGLYADTALHSAYTISIVAQGVPPTNPLYAGISLAYPFMVNFVSASLLLLGFSLRFAFIIPQLFYLLGFLALFYHLSRLLTTKLGTFLAILIFFFGWGLGFLTYFKDIQTTDSWQVKREYTNNLDNFHMHNVLTGLIFPERSFIPGLFIGLLITALMMPSLASSPKLSINNYQLTIIGALLGALPLWHTHTFLFFGAAIGIWILFPLLIGEGQGEVNNVTMKQYSNRKLRRIIGTTIFRLLLTYGPALLLSLPIIWWFNQQISHQRFLHVTSGWMNSGNQFMSFWFYNSGLLIPLSLVGIFLFKPKQRVAFFPALMMFMIANLVTFQPWNWDNIKLLSWVFLFLSISAGHFLSVILGRPKDDSRIRILDASGIAGLARMTTGLILLFSLTFSGILSVIHQASINYTIYDRSGIELAEWIKASTEPSDIFLIDPWPNHPVPGLTGRSVYLGYPGHLWVHGIAYQKREQTVREVLAGNLEFLKQTEVPIDYLVVETSHQTRFQNKAELELVYTNSRFAVFQIN